MAPERVPDAAEERVTVGMTGLNTIVELSVVAVTVLPVFPLRSRKSTVKVGVEAPVAVTVPVAVQLVPVPDTERRLPLFTPDTDTATPVRASVPVKARVTVSPAWAMALPRVALLEEM